jgi:hypothetical protein
VLVSRVRSHLERMERGLAMRGRRLPIGVKLALERMEARQDLFRLMLAQRTMVVHARIKGREPDPIAIDKERAARRFRRVRQLLGNGDDNERHRSDRDQVLRWERRTQGKPGEYARRWAGNWRRRQVEEILDKVDAKRGLDSRDLASPHMVARCALRDRLLSAADDLSDTDWRAARRETAWLGSPRQTRALPSPRPARPRSSRSP